MLNREITQIEPVNSKTTAFFGHGKPLGSFYRFNMRKIPNLNALADASPIRRDNNI